MALDFRTKQFRRDSFHWAGQRLSTFHIIGLKSGTWLAQEMSKQSWCKPVLPICAFISISACMTVIFYAVCMPKRERVHEEGRLNAVQPPVGTVIITLSGGHKSSMPHLCQVSWHWLSNEGCLSLTMFTIDHHVTVSQQAEWYKCLLLHLNCTALTHSHSSSDCFLISAAIHSEHDLLNHSLFPSLCTPPRSGRLE